MNKITELTKDWLRGALVGKRVRLNYSSDPFTKLSKGDEGVITDIDDLGTFHIKWDSGSTLGLIRSEDDWTVLE
jgi:hypothetical protein